MKRRDFLNRSLAASAGLVLMPELLTSCRSSLDPLKDFGLITNVVQHMMEEDHRGTMSFLADLGYKYLEFGGSYGEEPRELLKFMKGIGLKPLAGGEAALPSCRAKIWTRSLMNAWSLKKNT